MMIPRINKVYKSRENTHIKLIFEKGIMLNNFPKYFLKRRSEQF